jgi:predicted RNase H-like HicB family nuclease
MNADRYEQIMKFLVCIYKEEDGASVAECLAIPGCVGQGPTEAGAQANIANVIRECLAVRVEMGFPPIAITREIEVAV